MPLHPAHAQPSFTIDALDRLIDVNDSFLASLEPGIGSVERVHVIGRSLWDFLPSGSTKQLWQVMQGRVRAMGAPIFFPMRMDSACERRLVDVELHALGNDDIRHVLQFMWRESRPAIALLDRNYPRDSRRLRRCGWCARVQVRLGLWLEVEAAQEALAIRADATLPGMKDSVCTACKQTMLNIFPARAA